MLLFFFFLQITLKLYMENVWYSHKLTKQIYLFFSVYKWYHHNRNLYTFKICLFLSQCHLS